MCVCVRVCVRAPYRTLEEMENMTEEEKIEFTSK
eukprot:COSAG03_NODE_8339_length_811_cov_8.856742_2_plen_33_part_01